MALGLPRQALKSQDSKLQETSVCLFYVKILHYMIQDTRILAATRPQNGCSPSDSRQSRRLLWRNRLIFQLLHVHYVTECLIQFPPEDPRKFWLWQSFFFRVENCCVDWFRPEHLLLLSIWSTGTGFDYIFLYNCVYVLSRAATILSWDFCKSETSSSGSTLRKLRTHK